MSDTFFSPKFGDLVRDTRKSLNVTQTQFAAVAGVSQPYLSVLERMVGKPKEKTFKRIVTAFASLGVKFEWVVVDSDASHADEETAED